MQNTVVCVKEVIMAKASKFLVVPDKFRGSLSASQASHAIKMGILAANKDAHVVEFSMTDGGDAFVDTIAKAKKGAKVIRLKTIDPTGQTLTAKCALLDEDTALVGLTEASGINLVSEPERNPSKLTNIGTGQILAKLVERGYKTIIVGVGGSATNDGGIGLLIPLGFKFLDKDGNDIEPNGAGIAKLAKIVPPAAKISTKFIVATDISTPLLGESGAALQFAEQKGATREEAEQLEANMKHLVDVAQKSFGKSLHDAPGAGSAGGCGYGLMTFLDAKRVSGFDLFAKYADLESHIKSCNILITGEGKFDKTDAQGKGPYALAKLAAKYKKPVWIFCGSADVTDKDLADMKLSDVKIGQILPMAPNMVEAQNRAPKFLSHLARDFVAALK